MKDKKKVSLEETRSKYGGYWRDNHLDFHYLMNCRFPPKELIEELKDAVGRVANFYPSSQKREASFLADWKNSEHFTAENLIVSNGSSELIRILNDHVITRGTVPLPTFNEFISDAGRGHISSYALDPEENFRLDPKRLIEEAKKNGSQFVVIINPNNPFGSLTPISDIREVLDSGLHVITDETYMPFAGEEHSAERLIPEYDNLTVMASLTKTTGMAGLRLGYLLSGNEEIKRKVKAHLPIWNINSVAELLLERFPAYRAEHAKSLRLTKEDTEWFSKELEGINYLRPLPTSANGVLCKVEGSASKLTRKLFDRYSFMVKEGLNQNAAFGDVADKYVRLGVRNREDNQRLLDALNEIRQEEIK